MTPFSASRIKKALALIEVLALAFSPLAQAVARPAKKSKEPAVKFMSDVFAGKKAARVKRSVTRLGRDTGIVVEKFNERGVLLERVVNWGEVTVVEIDRNADGFLDEWQAFSDRGHMRLMNPRAGHFTQMSAEMIHRDQRYRMFFHRDPSGLFRLDSRKVAKLDVQWMFSEATGADAGSSDSTSFSADQTDSDNLHGLMGDKTNPGQTDEPVDMKALTEKVIDSSCKADSGFAKDYPKIQDGLGLVLKDPAEQDTKLYLRCMRSPELQLDAAASAIEARLYRKYVDQAQDQGKSSWKLGCQVCSGEEKSKTRVCKDDGKASAATDQTPTGDNSGNGSVYLKRPMQSGNSKSKKQDKAKDKYDYGDELFHEFLHTVKFDEKQARLIESCCSHNHANAKNCDSLKGLINKGLFYPTQVASNTPFGQTANDATTGKSAADQPPSGNTQTGSNSGGAPAGNSGGGGGSQQQASAPSSAPAKPAPAAPKPAPAQAAAQQSLSPADKLPAAAPKPSSTGNTQNPVAKPESPSTSMADNGVQAPTGSVSKPSEAPQSASAVKPASDAAATAQAGGASGPVAKTDAQGPTAAKALSGADANTAKAPTATDKGPADSNAKPLPGPAPAGGTASGGATAGTASPAAGGAPQHTSKADVQGPTAAQANTPRTESAKPAPSTSTAASSSSSSQMYQSHHHHDYGPQSAQSYDANSERQVAASFNQVLQAAVSVMSQNTQAPAVSNPSEPMQAKKSPAVAPLAERGNRPDPSGPAPQPLAPPKTAGAADGNGRAPASAGDPKADKDPQGAAKTAAATANAPGLLPGHAPAKDSSGKPVFAAHSPAAFVRQKAKRGNPAARRYFIKQMTLLDREEMRLALADHEVQNSLKEYVIGAIDDRHKRRDQSQNPKDWLIYNAQKNHLVHKQLGLARK